MKPKVLNAIRRVIEADPFAKRMGIRLVKLSPGHSKVEMRLKRELLNFHGIAHGGVIFSLADAAFAAASNSHGRVAVALNMEIDYRSSCKVRERITAEASEESLGERTALYHIVVRSGRRIVASCHGTVFRKESRLGVPTKA